MSNDDKKKTHVRTPPLPIGERGKITIGPKKNIRIGADPKKVL